MHEQQTCGLRQMPLVASVPPSGNLRSEVCPSPETEGWKNSPPEENESVDTDQDVAVGVDLQEVSIHGVKHKPPEHGSKEIWREVHDRFLSTH